MKKILLHLLPLVVIFAACQKNQNERIPADVQQPVQLQSTQEINAYISAVIDSKGEFNWKDASDYMLYSAIMHSDDHMVSVGYKPADEENVEEKLTRIDLRDNKWTSAKMQVLELIIQEEKLLRPQLKLEIVEVWKEHKLPVIDVRIDNINTLTLLRQSKLIRYVEPMGYEPERFDGQTQRTTATGPGCGSYSGDPNLVEGNDFKTVLPDAKQSWNYPSHTIPKAWVQSTGRGIKVMVIDTGVSPDQDNMGNDFNQGRSSGRTLQKIFTLPNATSADDICGHGTTMSSTVAAPRCIDGNSVGVAYNCNLVVCKASNDVIIDESSEVKGVADAFTIAADDTSVKITSLSLGRVTTSSQIKDAIIYAYDKGKLMFCAAGTSSIFTSWYGVIFPATMSQVQAVTGVKSRSTLSACNDCHKGAAVDFVTVMQQASDAGNPIANAMSGDVPTTVGGSSVATATAAGIAALVWSYHPSETRDQIVQRLVTTASAYPNRTSNFGWGKMDAYAAINK